VETGAVRFSLGWASTDADVQRALEGVESMAVARPRAISSS
jgi:cysteine sulfinate desulfinase/cysteine desulfurase-like protein